LAHRSLTDDRYVSIHNRGEFLQSVDGRAQWLRQERALIGSAGVQRDRSILMDGVALKEAKLVVGDAQHSIARLKPRPVSGGHGPDHFVQRVTDLRIRLLLVAQEKGEIGTTQAGQLGLKDDLPPAIRLGLKCRFRRLDELDAGRPRNVCGKQTSRLQNDKSGTDVLKNVSII
jgi:hypothetical protein